MPAKYHGGVRSRTRLRGSREDRRNVSFRSIAISLLAAAALWRLVLALLMPTISRDGVLFCWYARDLGERGLALLRADAYDQHPLFPALILALHRAMRACGFTDSPLLWQAAGQSASILSGLLLVCVTGWLAWRLHRALFPERNPQQTALWAMALTAALPLNTWLSADVMSDELHAALYLLSIVLLLDLRSLPNGLLGGACSGLAFLTRPEGASVALVATAALTLRALGERRGRPFALAGGVALGAAITAGPYMLYIGGVSTKADKQTVNELRAGGFMEPYGASQADARGLAPPMLAALQREDVAWWQAAPLAAYETLRGGRIIVPLLGLIALSRLRRRWLGEPLCIPVGCVLLHFALVVLLLKRHGYLDPRHTLVITSVLIPAAALTLVDVLRWARLSTGRALPARLLVVVTLAPLLLLSMRIPHGADTFVPRAVRWLREQEGAALHTRALLGGKSERRIAFYAGMRHIEWSEGEPTAQAKAEALSDLIDAGRPDYFAIEIGSAELAQNQDVLERLLEAPERADRIAEAARFPAGREGRNTLLLHHVAP